MTHETNTEQEIAKARELLAAEYDKDGSRAYANDLRNGRSLDKDAQRTIRAIIAALRTARQGNEPHRDSSYPIGIELDPQKVALLSATPASASGEGQQGERSDALDAAEEDAELEGEATQQQAGQAVALDGYVLVPREPTEAMLCAAADAAEDAGGHLHEWETAAAYRAMLAAAPVAGGE